jgi:hypothetical protein
MKLCSILRCDTDLKLRKLEKENLELKEKLADRQEVINKTNAYWKKRLASMRSDGLKPRKS